MIKRLFLIGLLFSAFLASGQGIVLDTDFETDGDIIAGSSDYAWRDDLPNNNTSYVYVGGAREGSRAIRMRYNGAERNELVHQTRRDWGTEYWIGYSIRVDERVNGYEIITQHRPEEEGQNSFSISTPASNKLRILTATDVTKTFVDPESPCAICGLVATDVTIVPGEWNDIVINIISATDTSGKVIVWVNGVQVVNITGQPTVYAIANGGASKTATFYEKIGLYYGPLGSTGDIYFDAYKVWEGPGGSYESVSPLGLSPGTGGGTPPIIITTGTGKQKTQTAQLISH